MIFYLDDDGDGFGDPNIGVKLCNILPRFVNNNGDCDDTNPDISQMAENCDNVNNDCDDSDVYDGIDEKFCWRWLFVFLRCRWR